MKNELEEECDKLQLEVSEHQSVLEETRISSQEMIDEQQEQSDKLQDEIKELSDSNKLLLAQKQDLTYQLHNKLKSDLLQDSNSDMLNSENERLKINIHSLK
eukprot:872003_1